MSEPGFMILCAKRGSTRSGSAHTRLRRLYYLSRAWDGLQVASFAAGFSKAVCFIQMVSLRVDKVVAGLVSTKVDMATSEIQNASPLPRVLKPYIPGEVIKAREAAEYAGVHQGTIGNWARRYSLGRVIGRDLLLSRVALQAFLEDDFDLLAAYLAGDREAPEIRQLYARLGIDLPASRSAVAE